MYPGRSLNSCQAAFGLMCQQNVQPPAAVRPATSQPLPLHHESTAPAAPVESSSVRKRPLCLATDRPLAPRAIQPRPAHTPIAPYGRESSASTQTSPGTEEPPRKRGRPSKADMERRKAAAEAVGETYQPPPRRTGSGKSKTSTATAPNSPAGSLVAAGISYSPRASVQGLEGFKPEIPTHYTPSAERVLDQPTGFGGNEQRPRAMSDQNPRPITSTTNRELPRPPDVRQTLPSPQALQLHPEMVPRLSTTEPRFEPFPPERIPRAFDATRPMLADPASSRRPDQPPISAATLNTSIEKTSR